MSYIEGKREPPPAHRRCAQVYSNRDQCKAIRMNAYRYCYFHEPSIKEKRLAASRKGGNANRGNQLVSEATLPELATLEDVRSFAVETLHQVRMGELDPRTAMVVSNLVGHVLKTLPDSRDAAEGPADKLRRILMEDDNDTDFPEVEEDGEDGGSLHGDGPGIGEVDQVSSL